MQNHCRVNTHIPTALEVTQMTFGGCYRFLDPSFGCQPAIQPICIPHCRIQISAPVPYSQRMGTYRAAAISTVDLRCLSVMEWTHEPRAGQGLGTAHHQVGLCRPGAEPVALNTTEFKMLLPNEGKLLSTRIKEQKTSSTDGCWRPAIAPKYYFFIATSAL